MQAAPTALAQRQRQSLLRDCMDSCRRADFLAIVRPVAGLLLYLISTGFDYESPSFCPMVGPRKVMPHFRPAAANCVEEALLFEKVAQRVAGERKLGENHDAGSCIPGDVFGRLFRNALFIASYMLASTRLTCPGWLSFSSLIFSLPLNM
jgi:hypothetical protein